MWFYFHSWVLTKGRQVAVGSKYLNFIIVLVTNSWYLIYTWACMLFIIANSRENAVCAEIHVVQLPIRDGLCQLMIHGTNISNTFKMFVFICDKENIRGKPMYSLGKCKYVDHTSWRQFCYWASLKFALILFHYW